MHVKVGGTIRKKGHDYSRALHPPPNLSEEISVPAFFPPVVLVHTKEIGTHKKELDAKLQN